jgi:hypothetical protein
MFDDMTQDDYGSPDDWTWVTMTEVLEEYTSIDAAISVDCPGCGSSTDEVDAIGLSRWLNCGNCGMDFEYEFEEILEAKLEDSGIAEIQDSLIKHGFIIPLHRWRKGDYWAVTDGHHRLAVAHQLGIEKLPFIDLDDSRADSLEWEVKDGMLTH